MVRWLNVVRALARQQQWWHMPHSGCTMINSAPTVQCLWTSHASRYVPGHFLVSANLRNRRTSTKHECLTVQHCQSAVLGSRWAAYAVAGASAAAILAHQVTEMPAACLEHPKAAYVGDEDTEIKIQDFKQWLDGLGAHVDALDIRESLQVCKPYSENHLSHVIARGKTAVQKCGHFTTAQSFRE